MLIFRKWHKKHKLSRPKNRKNNQSWGVVTNPRLLIFLYSMGLLGFPSWDIIALTYLRRIQLSIITFIHITFSVSTTKVLGSEKWPKLRGWPEAVSRPTVSMTMGGTKIHSWRWRRFNHDESGNIDC